MWPVDSIVDICFCIYDTFSFWHDIWSFLLEKLQPMVLQFSIPSQGTIHWPSPGKDALRSDCNLWVNWAGKLDCCKIRNRKDANCLLSSWNHVVLLRVSTANSWKLMHQRLFWQRICWVNILELWILWGLACAGATILGSFVVVGALFAIGI